MDSAGSVTSTRHGARRRCPVAGRILPLLLGAVLLAAPGSALAKVTGDTIVLGAAVSLTGKYTTAGHHTRNGYVPPYQAAESTAAVMVWADALQRAGAFDAETVRDALAATDMQTFYGNIRFDETGRNVAKPMVLRQIQNGVYRVVAPTEWASHELVFPRPH